MIEEHFSPERTILVLTLRKSSAKKAEAADTRSAVKQIKKQLIIEYLTEHVSARTAEVAEYVGLKPVRAREYLNELMREEIVIAEGGRSNRLYKLKA